MKMKLIALISASFLAIVFFAGCTNQSAKPTNSEKSVLNAISNTIPDDELPIWVLPMNGSGAYFRGGAYSRLLGDFLQSVSVELESATCSFDNGNSEYRYFEKYYVLRCNNENVGDYYLYVFFRNYDDNTSESSNWMRCGRAVRVIKRLSAKDFENITVGSTIEDVKTVDPVTEVMIPEFEYYDYENNTTHSTLSFETFHYTVDGLYYIKFERETGDDEFLVSKIELDSSFEIPIYDRFRFSDYEYANGLDLDNPEPPVYQKIELRHLPD